MPDEDYCLGQDNLSIKECKTALEAALKCEVVVSECIHADIPNVFAEKFARRICLTRNGLIEKYGDQFEGLIALSIRLYVYEYHSAETSMSALLKTRNRAQIVNEYEFNAPSDSWALALRESLASNLPIDLLHGTSLDAFPCDSDILETMSIVWFFDAARNHRNDSNTAMNMLFEAVDALGIADGLRMWDGNDQCHIDSVREANVTKSKTLNKGRHRKDGEAKKKVCDEFEKNKYRFTSAEKAGKKYSVWLLSQGLDENSEPKYNYTQRTVTGWISKYAKEIGFKFR